MMRSTQERRVLIGIVSWGIGNQCDTKHYSMFTNVGHMYEWIEQRAKTSEEEVSPEEFDTQ